MKRIVMVGMWAALWLCAIPAGYATGAGQWPLSYRVAPAAYPWTGRLHATAFRTTAYADRREVLDQWQAGDLLDKRATDSRRLYLGGARLTPLRWQSIDAQARAMFDIDPATGQPDARGAERLSWLRGNRPDAAMRPRDTRLASGAGARVHGVPPPGWQPMQPGHTDFRNRHAQRPATVWLGTRDGLVHGFDAVTGQEIAGYLPRTLLAEAASLTAAGTRVPAAPCPRPDSIDADPAGQWRTLLLCAIPAAGRADGAGAAFVLDVSAPEAATPIQLVWEVTANDALPLTGSGPLRAAMRMTDEGRRWFAIAILAATAAGERAGLALLPLDRAASTWASAGRVQRLLLPASGCAGDTTATQLLAVSVRNDASGVARAAYATDNAGRLWRFPLDAAGAGRPANTATCLYRQASATGSSVEPPVITYPGATPLIAYGTGNAVSVVPDTPGRPVDPRHVTAMTAGEGVILRASAPSSYPGTSGWTLSLPHPGEQVDRLYAASPVHLGFTTLMPDGSARSYLLDAATGESVTVLQADGGPGPAVTGLSFDPDQGWPIVSLSARSPGPATTPGGGQRDVYELGLWQIDGDRAHLQQHTRLTRRRGRLGWRELIRTPL